VVAPPLREEQEAKRQLLLTLHLLQLLLLQVEGSGACSRDKAELTLLRITSLDLGKKAGKGAGIY
jgi:hypothetical protein